MGLMYKTSLQLYAGLVGRNGTGKTTFLRHMALHAIDGIPSNCQILHVEQEVEGDDTTALQCVLNTDIERTQLLEEEARLLALQVEYLLFYCITEKILVFSSWPCYLLFPFNFLYCPWCSYCIFILLTIL